jgi:hypothetical protein
VLAGQIGTIVSVQESEKSDHNTFNIAITLDESGQTYYGRHLSHVRPWIDGVAFLREIDDARRLFVGKTLWLKDGHSVTVTDIVVADGRYETARFFVKAADGGEQTYDVYLGMSNPDHAIEKCKFFKEEFYEKDPAVVAAEAEAKRQEALKAAEAKRREALKAEYKKFGWSQKTWDAIFNNRVLVGMNKLQATLAWGKPRTINRTVTAAGVSEQWVYSIKSYLYFEGDRLIAIQN